MRYYHGQGGIIKDESQAVVWLWKAAAQGIVGAQSLLGACYEGGSGVCKDHALAVMWHIKAAEQGHISTQYELGRRYLDGNNVPKDPAQGFVWVKMAAEQGFISALWTLAQCYENGTGVGVDLVQAAHWYQKYMDQLDENNGFVPNAKAALNRVKEKIPAANAALAGAVIVPPGQSVPASALAAAGVFINPLPVEKELAELGRKIKAARENKDAPKPGEDVPSLATPKAPRPAPQDPVIARSVLPHDVRFLRLGSGMPGNVGGAGAAIVPPAQSAPAAAAFTNPLFPVRGELAELAQRMTAVLENNDATKRDNDVPSLAATPQESKRLRLANQDHSQKSAPEQTASLSQPAQHDVCSLRQRPVAGNVSNAASFNPPLPSPPSTQAEAPCATRGSSGAAAGTLGKRTLAKR